MLPESNHTSITSGTRRMVPPHVAHGKATASMNGRCRSLGIFLANFFSSATDPTTCHLPHPLFDCALRIAVFLDPLSVIRNSEFANPHCQTGNGVPQYR